MGLGCHSKEAGDEGDLPENVSIAYPADLSLANHMHHLIPLERSPCRLKGKEAHPWLDESFDEAMVLLDQVLQVFDLPQFDRFGKHPAGFEPAPLSRKREIFGWTVSQEEGTSLRSLPGTDDLVANPWDLKDFQKLSMSMRAKGSASFLGG